MHSSDFIVGIGKTRDEIKWWDGIRGINALTVDQVPPQQIRPKD